MSPDRPSRARPRCHGPCAYQAREPVVWMRALPLLSTTRSSSDLVQATGQGPGSAALHRPAVPAASTVHPPVQPDDDGHDDDGGGGGAIPTAGST
eukprot:scaffold13_cov377-Prasinococcus_capsulatus_cf.AAC.20